ncbi:hypothetical protein Tco_0366281 [Tanacetum coccineum]
MQLRDELCPPNKRYDLMDANKKVDLEHEDGSKYRIKFMLDKKEHCLTLDDFKTIFHLPHANDNNHNSFVPPPSFSDMVSFYKQQLGFAMELKTSSSFKTTGLPQPWQTLCKIFYKCLTTRRHKDRVGMQIPDWMITEEMRHTEYYRMYAEVFGLDVPLTQSQPTESTQRTHRTPSAPRRSTRLTPPAPVPTVDKADEMILQDTLQVSLAEHKSREEQEARENVELVNKHLRREKGKIVEESKSTPFPIPIRSPRTHTNLVSSDTEKLQELTPNLLGSNDTRISFRSYRDVIHICLDISKRDFCQGSHSICLLIISKKLERQKTKEEMERMIAKAILQERRNIQAEISSQIYKAIDNQIPSQVDASIRSYMSGHILHVHPAQSQTHSVPEQQYQMYLSMKNDSQLQQQDIAIWVALQIKFKNLQKTSEYEAYVSGESSSGQVNEEERGPSTSGKQEQVDDYDFCTDSYASDDDEIPMKQVSQDIMKELSLTIDEAKLKKMADEMFRQRCTSGDEHQYHIDQMKNFLKSDIIWESRKEILVSPHPRKTIPLIQSYQRDSEVPALSLINQDLLYLKKGSPGPKKIVFSLYKFPAIIFNDDDIEEQTSKWVNKRVKIFNPYARYGVEHWKNPHAKIFYIKKQKEPGKPKEAVYSNSKIIQVIKTYWELGHEHKFITKIVARRANECIVSITEPDYKNLNKNDIEDMYLLIMNGKVPDYAETGLLWSLSVFIKSSLSLIVIVSSINKCVKKFNPYARYGVEHWKNPHAKIFYIKKQKEPGKPKEEVYSNSKIIQVIKTYWELGHEHKFITEIVARRANECIVSITEPDYKNLNKNDIEDMYLLIMNGKVPDYAETGLLWSLSVFIRSSVIWERVHDFQLGIESYQQKVNLTAPTISFPGVEKHKMFSIIYEPVHGIIYKNSKKEKRVMRHSEIHKFCDATLNRVLEGLKSYNNDVKYGYVQRELTNDEVEYLKLFEEEIEVRLKYRNQMRRWEMYVNGRPLGPRRERPE